MKYRYRILWFEDNQDPLKERYEKQLTDHLDGLGFELEIDWQPSKPAKTFPYQNYDIIITDLNFEEVGGKETAGIEILNHVRQGKILTDVLLYSSSPDRLKGALDSLKVLVERVSFNAGNDNMLEKIQLLIGMTIRKVQTVAHIRGLVITEAIDLEKRIKDITHTHFATIDANRRSTKVLRAESCKASKVKFFKKKAEKAAAIDAERLEKFCDDECLSAFDHLTLLRGCVKDSIKHHAAALKSKHPGEHAKAIKELKDVELELGKINDEILSARNTLAHVREERTADGSIVFKSRGKGGKDLVLDEAWCTKQRNIFRSHSRNLIRTSTLL